MAILEEKPFGPVHPITDPSVDTPRVTLALWQVTCPPVALTDGAVVSSVTVAVAVAVHPLADATVTVYVPGALTAGLASLEANPLGPVHPVIVAVVAADSVTELVTHVIVPPVAVADGA